MSALALGAFAAHTILPDEGSIAHFFDYRLYCGLVVVPVALDERSHYRYSAARGSRLRQPSAPIPSRSSSGCFL